jgi:hypothetical protein
LKNVEQYYQECIQQGFEFPPAEPENIIKAAVPPTVNRNYFYPDLNFIMLNLGNN